MTKNKVIKEILLKRGRISVKMSSLGNDLASRGRRHDNSYTSETELDLLIKIKETTDETEKKRLQKLLDGIHSNVNDYLPAFHNNDLSKMNMMQLLEFITHKVSEYDVMIVENGCKNDLDHYTNHVVNGLEITSELEGIIRNTVDYIINRNAVILKNLTPRTEIDQNKLEVVKFDKTSKE